jgi:transcriptional regulator with XRE-family HTH domain
VILRDTDAVAAFYSDLGRRITTARKDAGLTQDALGRAVGLSRSSICNLENGVQQTTLHTLLAICEAAGVTLAVLVEGSAAGGAVQASAAARAAKVTASALQKIDQARRDARKLDAALGELVAEIGGGGPPLPTFGLRDHRVTGLGVGEPWATAKGADLAGAWPELITMRAQIAAGDEIVRRDKPHEPWRVVGTVGENGQLVGLDGEPEWMRRNHEAGIRGGGPR